MLSGGLISQTPLLLGFRQIPAYKSIVPLQGFEPCFVLRLFNQSCTPYTKWRVSSAANGDFRCLENTPEKRGYAFLTRIKLTRSLRLPMSKGIEVTQLISIIITKFITFVAWLNLLLNVYRKRQEVSNLKSSSIFTNRTAIQWTI